MLKEILDAPQQALVAQTRSSLLSAADMLAAHEIPEESRKQLSESIRQIDALFLLVVVGEFNAGKSALINALLGTDLLEEGVTPTTSRIQLISWAQEPERKTVGAALEEVGLPVELLRDLRIVDTPGTNALNREHEAITVDFVPRSDLVLFITSADRPFSESERLFLEKLRDWGKKIFIVINKKDILEDPAEQAKVEDYVNSQSLRLLGMKARIFLISARQARRARERNDDEGIEASGLPELEKALRETLDEKERLRLKLLNPVGVASKLVETSLKAASQGLGFLEEDRQTLEDIEAQLKIYREDIDREFNLRLAEMENSLHRMELRGVEYFDETIRLGRLPDLIRKERIRREYEEKVVADTPEEIEREVNSLIDWLVEMGIRQWHAVVEHVRKRESRHPGRIVGQIGGSFESDRARLLETVGRAAREGMESYDREEEARRMVEELQLAVAGTALVEVGAVGLGTTVALIASSAAADVTGLVAAGVMAALGLVIIPAQRRRAKKALRERIAETREKLMSAMTLQFKREADGSLKRIQDTIAPYSRFVRSQRETLEKRLGELERLRDELAARRREIEQA